MGSAHQELKRTVLGRVGGGGLGLKWQPRHTLAGLYAVLLLPFAKANQKQRVLSVYFGTDYK